MAREGWTKALWLAKKIDNTYAVVRGIYKSLSNISLVVKGVGNQLIGTTITVSNGTDTLSAVWDASLVVTFNLSDSGLGEYVITYQRSETETAQQKVIINEFGYFEETVTYFPGYDIWEWWCELGGISSADYESLNELLADETSVTILMNSNSATEYLIESGAEHNGEADSLMTNVIAKTTALLIMCRSSNALTLLKAESGWRSAIIGNTDAVKAIYAATDVIQETNGIRVDLGSNIAGQTSNANKTGTIDSSNNTLLIAIKVINDLQGYGTSTAQAVVAGKVFYSVSNNCSTSETMSRKQGIKYNSTIADIVTSYQVKGSVTATDEGTSSVHLGATATAYYI